MTALGSQTLSGRELAAKFKEQTGKSISYGSLYVTMSRLRDKGWIEETDSDDEDGRVRHFQVTGEGSSALREARRFFGRVFGFLKGATA